MRYIISLPPHCIYWPKLRHLQVQDFYMQMILVILCKWIPVEFFISAFGKDTSFPIYIAKKVCNIPQNQLTLALCVLPIKNPMYISQIPLCQRIRMTN